MTVITTNPAASRNTTDPNPLTVHGEETTCKHAFGPDWKQWMQSEKKL